MSEKRGRGQPKFEPTQDQRSQVKQMKALGIPEDRICKMIANPRTGKPVSPMTLARAFAEELESGATEFHTPVGNFILCAILGKKPALGDAIKSEQVRMRQNPDALERDGGERAGHPASHGSSSRLPARADRRPSTASHGVGSCGSWCAVPTEARPGAERHRSGRH